MTPADISVIALDGKTHNVTAKEVISIAVNNGTIEPVEYVDSEGNVTIADGRTSFLITRESGTRYVCSCGLSFDAADSALDSDPRFAQGASVDCPSC